MKNFNLFKVDNPEVRDFFGVKKIMQNKYGIMCFDDGKTYTGLYYIIFDMESCKYSYMCPKGKVLLNL